MEVCATSQPLCTETLSLARAAELISIFIHSHVTVDLLRQLPAVRFIATRSTGFDHIDLAACEARSIVVSNVPTYGENTVAEHAFALILSLSRKIHAWYARTARGDFSLEGLRGFDLRGSALGVIGTGNIGLHMVRLGRGFGMEVLANDVREQPTQAEMLGFRYVALDELLSQADVVSLHVPLFPSTHHLINRERLARMKRGSLLINTARGGLVDTDALLWALDEGILGGAGLDVLEGSELATEEHLLLSKNGMAGQARAKTPGHVLLHRDDVVVTPHIAFDSEQAIQRILECTAANVQAFLNGQPTNVLEGRATRTRS